MDEFDGFFIVGRVKEKPLSNSRGLGLHTCHCDINNFFYGIIFIIAFIDIFFD